MTEGISNVHDVMHLCQDRVKDADPDGKIRGLRRLRSAYKQLNESDRRRVREVSDYNIQEGVRDGDFRTARAWLACYDAVLAVTEDEEL